jgi:hypothetical protein
MNRTAPPPARATPFTALLWALPWLLAVTPLRAIDGATLRIETFNGWRAFEVITQGDDPSGDGISYAMPGTFDGGGARLVDPATLRVLVNHETGDASISEVDLDLASLQTAIGNMIDSGGTGGVSFVLSARQAYGRWSADGGSSFTSTSSNASTSFARFCSGQAYAHDTFGPGRGFVDPLYVTGEEVIDGRLFALDSVNRDLYQLSGTVGSAAGGIGGMSFDSWENAALIDTGETGHVALLLSPDGGSSSMKLYIGEKGRDADGSVSSGFLARNGLAYGSWYYLQGSLPANLGSTNDGTFGTTSAAALSSTKLEDIDTSPGDPTRAVLGDQDSGVFTFHFDLVFAGGFEPAASGFSVTKISNQGGGDGSLDAPDNVAWTAATTLGSISHPQGLIFVNEDSSSGEIWQMDPGGGNQVRIGSTTVGAESTGIFDLSERVGYAPGSILITNNQGSPSSMTVLIHPDAAALPGAGWVTGLLVSRPSPATLRLDWQPSCSADDDDYAVYSGDLGLFTSHVPESCGTGGVTGASLALPAGDRYYLVVPLDRTVEGSYGESSDGMERPTALAACGAQSIDPACP